MCYIMGDHDWTCDSAEGIPPTDSQLDAGVDGFKDYARMYCKRCYKESEVQLIYNHKIYDNINIMSLEMGAERYKTAMILHLRNIGKIEYSNISTVDSLYTAVTNYHIELKDSFKEEIE